eukprot:682692-Rhodomonas_salina.4
MAATLTSVVTVLTCVLLYQSMTMGTKSTVDMGAKNLTFTSPDFSMNTTLNDLDPNSHEIACKKGGAAGKTKKKKKGLGKLLKKVKS